MERGDRVMRPARARRDAALELATFVLSTYRGVCVFFFQAEDGIRDGTVTGVQTCALPILRAGADDVALAAGRVAIADRTACWMVLHGAVALLTPARSEERRVGKECRSRWARDDEKRKRYGARNEDGWNAVTV